MHKLESFALSVGSKINEPFIESLFYPLVDTKFICVSKNSTSEAKSYDHFDDVIFHIKPFLDKEGISILELGKTEQAPVFYTKDYRHLNRLQSNFVIEKSLMYFGNLNIYAHLASRLHKKVVCPINNDYINSIKPYWSNPDECVFLGPDTDQKPTMLDSELPKTINQVNPELVASRILESLNIKHNLNKVDTIYIGQEYNSNIVDFVPGSYDPTKFQRPSIANVRMDKNFDLNFLLGCSKMKDLTLITRQMIPSEVINYVKNSLNQITFFVDKNTKPEEITNLESAGKPLLLLCDDFKNIKQIRLNLIDYNINEYQTNSKKDLKCKSLKNLKFLSKRNIVSDGNLFNSYLSIAEGRNVSTVLDKKVFWEDLKFCRIYKEKP